MRSVSFTVMELTEARQLFWSSFLIGRQVGTALACFVGVASCTVTELAEANCF